MKAKNQNFSQSSANKCRWIPVVLCHPLSLSLTSLLSRPVYIQGSGVESPDPTRIGEGARVHLSEEASPGGRGRFHFSAGFRRQGPCGGTGRAASLWLAASGLVRTKTSRVSEGPSWSFPTDMGTVCPVFLSADYHGGARRTWSSAWTILSH